MNYLYSYIGSYRPFAVFFVAFISFSTVAFAEDSSGIVTRISTLLNEEEITLEDLKEDPELRQRWLKQLRKMRGIPTQQQKVDGVENRIESSIHTEGLIRIGDFYKVIISNNLFRPLGYGQAKSSTPPFELVATVFDSKSGKGKALILNNRNRKTYYVTVGQEFAGAKVEQIDTRKVTLRHDGKLKEFHASKTEFLNTGIRGNHGNDRVLSSIRQQYSGFAR